MHDLLLSKNGIAAPDKHVLKVAVLRHKTRLNAEFTKIRIRKGYATLQDFRNDIERGDFDNSSDSGESRARKAHPHPRWVRINPLNNDKWDIDHYRTSGYFDDKDIKPLSVVMSSSKGTMYMDQNIPGLIAYPPGYNISSTNSYLDGHFIIQDKASCFPALLLVDAAAEGRIIDACAAPGNKTTQLAALYGDRIPHPQTSIRPTTYNTSGKGHSSGVKATNKSSIAKSSKDGERFVFAFERSKERSRILKEMVSKAHADELVEICEATDFFDVDPEDPHFANVRGILLDPSCSGSGMIERNEEVDLSLPSARQTSDQRRPQDSTQRQHSKKRKRHLEDTEEEQFAEQDGLQTRLEALSKFQQRLIQQAMSFSSVVMIAYSTCSIHPEENESVVIQALASSIAKEKGWTLLKRNQQFNGLRRWHIRGDERACAKGLEEVGGLEGWTAKSIADALLRCNKETEDGTMGFFATGFIRKYDDDEKERRMQKERKARRLLEAERQAKWDSLSRSKDISYDT